MSQALIPLTTENFRDKALAIPEAIARFLAENPPVEKVKNGMDYLALQAEYAKKIKAETSVVNAIQYGRLQLIARYGELNPAPTPEERGAMGGRGKKAPDREAGAFADRTLARYREVTAHQSKLEDYRDEQAKAKPDEEISMAGFIRFATGTEKAGTAAHVSLNTGIPEWYTPAVYLEAVRDVLGRIELDPASSEIAQQTVRARTYYTLEDDGLSKDWQGRVYMNPPYSADMVGKFVNKLCDHVKTGDVSEAILLVNNATETKWLQRALARAAAVCFPAGRIRFLDEGGNAGGAPLQGQVFLYFGKAPWAFSQFFNEFGTILYGGKDELWQFAEPA
jgi:ParB family chromosome partitioning protein